LKALAGRAAATTAAGDEGFERFVDGRGRRWRVAREFAAALRRDLAPWIEAGEPPPQLAPSVVALKRSSRRDVFAAAPADAPPLVLKRYPPRDGLLGRARDRLATRALAEFRRSRELLASGLAIPAPLALVEPPPGSGAEPAWFASQRIVGALPLGGWLEERHRPGDGAEAKFALVHRALDQLRRVHELGVWHRDFHGGNLLLREAEGPAGVLWLIDLHSALDLGTVPSPLRARDVADLLHSLRYSCDEEEVAALAGESARLELEPAQVLVALRARRRAHARSRALRAFVTSSRFAQTRLDRWRVSHDRSLAPEEIGELLERHAQSCARRSAGVLRIGTRSRLTSLEPAGGRRVVVKEFLGSGARRRARAAFRNTVAARVRDLPAALPLAFVRDGRDDPAFFLAEEVAGSVPLHLAALRPEAGARDPSARTRTRAVAHALADLMARLLASRFVHRDLSLKNLLLVERPDAPPAVVLVDLDAARPGKGWSRRRILKGLAQLGDLPEAVFSRSDRLRWLIDLRERLDRRAGGRLPEAGALLRATGALLRRRRRLAAGRTPSIDAAPLRTLHLFGNWKWTGPADPAVALAAALKPEATLLLGACPFEELGQPVARRAAERDVPHELHDSLQKHWNPLRTARAAADVARRIDALHPALIHVHLDADHAAAARAVAAAPDRIAIVRSIHAPGPHRPRSRRLFERSAELLLAPSRGLATGLERELALSAGAVGVLETSVDLGRFAPDEAKRARGRARLGLGESDVVFGIVARIQSHRRWELLFEAWAALAKGERPPRLVVLGRGTRQEELAREPVERLGLQSLVLLPGYQEGEDYVEALAACDAAIFLVPGSDVSCRAAREWMAAGRAVIATRRTPLPEIVSDGVDGRLVDETAESLAAAVRDLLDSARRSRAGENALATARRRFDPRRFAAHARAFDRLALLALPGVAARWRAPARAVVAVPPGELPERLDELADAGIAADDVVALDPRRSRDVVLDLFALLAATDAKRLVAEARADWLDATVVRELARRRIEWSRSAAT
jgi:glycosyltransferase involved in cell wall biosynthesis